MHFAMQNLQLTSLYESLNIFYMREISMIENRSMSCLAVDMSLTEIILYLGLFFPFYFTFSSQIA